MEDGDCRSKSKETLSTLLPIDAMHPTGLPLRAGKGLKRVTTACTDVSLQKKMSIMISAHNHAD